MEERLAQSWASLQIGDACTDHDCHSSELSTAATLPMSPPTEPSSSTQDERVDRKENTTMGGNTTIVSPGAENPISQDPLASPGGQRSESELGRTLTSNMDGDSPEVTTATHV